MTYPTVTNIEERTVQLRLRGDGLLTGDLAVPPDARGLVIFAHGSGSSRLSPRNRAVASTLSSKGFATLLLDLLTPHEERIDEFTRHHRFDIQLLADRVGVAVDWAIDEPTVRDLPIGIFGASTGAAAALVAAAGRQNEIRAIVSRGGRPDLAGAALEHVKAPTLLIVGGSDIQVIDLNRTALALLSCVKRIEIVPHATHLFEEPGALHRVAELAANWFAANLN